MEEMLAKFISVFRQRKRRSFQPDSQLRCKSDVHQAPYIHPKDYGKLTLKFRDRTSLQTKDEDSLTIRDLYTHTIVLGESGSGKTFYVLNQLFEELFRSTHLPPGSEREKMKLGGLVIEAKGDFTPKAKFISKKYDRIKDVIFFGPDHLDNSYNLFGDPTETPQQLADKMMQLLTAFGGGKKAEDPFWDNAARKLFTHIFLLHRRLQENKTLNLPPLSFGLLNLLILDRGHPYNQAELDADRVDWDKTYTCFQEELGFIRSLTLHARVESEGLLARYRTLSQELECDRQEFAVLIGRAPDKTDPTFFQWEREVIRRQNQLTEHQDKIANLTPLLCCGGDEQTLNGLIGRLDHLRISAQGLLNAPNDTDRGNYYQTFTEESGFLIELILPHLASLNGLSNHSEEERHLVTALQKNLLLLIDHLTLCIDLGEKILEWNPPSPQLGMLRRLLQTYTALLNDEGQTTEQDALHAYFQEEYLNVVNDKTSGSVGMVASNLVTLFVHPPFNHIFSAQPTFSMSSVIDQGKVIVLDMPIALYGAISTVAALVLKIDFFRTMLSRHRLKIEGVVSENPQRNDLRTINQDRPMTYFCDEFASVASTGDTTGEAGFLDKVREYKCCCILGLQSIPMLLKKFSPAEVDAILTNCANKIFLRNSDPRTTEVASKVFGTEFKVNLNRGHTAVEMALNADMPVGKEGYTSSYSMGNRVEPGEFSRLKDGVAHLKLNPRFGEKQMIKASFVGHPIPTPETA